GTEASSRVPILSKTWRPWILTISAVSAVLLLLVVGVWALTVPKFATPIARAVLHRAYGRDASVASAWLTFKHGPTAHLRGFVVPGHIEASVLDAHLDLGAWMTGRRPIASLEASDASFSLGGGASGGSKTASKGGSPLSQIAALDLNRLTLIYTTKGVLKN